MNGSHLRCPRLARQIGGGRAALAVPHAEPRDPYRMSIGGFVSSYSYGGVAPGEAFGPCVAERLDQRDAGLDRAERLRDR